MARLKAAENATDPATGRPLPQGVTYLGAMRYRTRKLVEGKRINKTFPTARLAREWLESASVAVRAGKFIDARPLDKMTVLVMVEKYVEEMMQEGGTRRGYKQDLGHIPALKNDEIASLPDQIAFVNQPFDHLRARGWRTEAALAHRFAEFLIVDEFARTFHRGK